MQRDNLQPPFSQMDSYLYDIATSLRAVVDLLTPQVAEPVEVTELREPESVARKPKTRDELQTADDAPAGATQAPLEKPATVASRRHPKAS